LNICADSEIPAEEQALALRYIEFGDIIGNPVYQPSISDSDFAAIMREIEAEQVATLQGRPRGPDEQVVVVP
jgi:hypothetical protein